MATRGRRKNAVPQYLHHRKWDLARVRWKGKDFYLGRYESKESKRLYAHFLRWIQVTDSPPENWEELDPAKFTTEATDQADATHGVTIAELLVRYLRFAKGYYLASNEVEHIKYAVRPLNAMFAELPAVSFGPLCLAKVRDQMVDDGLTRSGINKRITRIRRIFRWAVANELIPGGVYEALKTVEGLKMGRTAAPDNAPVACVPDDQIEAVKPYVLPQVWAMIQLQRYSGMRPGEATAMRTSDIDSSNEIWVYRPRQHKTRHHGKKREIYLGHRSQAILRDWLREDDAYLFSPKEAVAWQREQRAANRRTPPSCGNRSGTNRVSDPKRRLGDHYTVKAYRSAIKRACRKAGIDTWAPNRIRHTTGTAIREQFGVEEAQATLGHSRIDATQIYAEVSKRRAVQVATEIG